MATDYYALLGVSRNATDDEIKRAYRKLARQLHPDANGGDSAAESRFKEVTLAYETLRDPERRRRYDMFGPEGLRGSSGDGMDPGNLFGGGIGDIFDVFFGGGSGGTSWTSRPAQPHGEDAEVSISISFIEAVFGVAKRVSLRLAVACSACAGSGASAGTAAARCPDCSGSGQVRQLRRTLLGQMVTASPCPRCQGRGQVIPSPCKECSGDGRVMADQSYDVDIPAGVDDGNTLRIGGRGAAGLRGTPPGDLYVHLKVQPDPRFARNGYDVEHVLHVPMTQAALGARVHVETLEGSEEIEIPPGTQSGETMVLRGRGIPQLRGHRRGNFVVRVAVDTPTQLTKAQEELLRHLARERSEEVPEPHEGLLAKLRSARS